MPDLNPPKADGCRWVPMSADEFSFATVDADGMATVLLRIAASGFHDSNRDELRAYALACRAATVGTGRTWTVLIPAPCALWSANDAHRSSRFSTTGTRKDWRQAGYEAAQINRLPRGLSRIRLALTFHFVKNARRDALNYADTAKPIIDAWGPPFHQAPTPKKPRGASAPGWSLIPDDTPAYLESTTLAIGPLWPAVVKAAPEYDRARLTSTFGGVTAVITELTPPTNPLPAAPTARPALFGGLA
jgi:hypothetical protein